MEFLGDNFQWMWFSYMKCLEFCIYLQTLFLLQNIKDYIQIYVENSGIKEFTDVVFCNYVVVLLLKIQKFENFWKLFLWYVTKFVSHLTFWLVNALTGKNLNNWDQDVSPHLLWNPVCIWVSIFNNLSVIC